MKRGRKGIQMEGTTCTEAGVKRLTRVVGYPAACLIVRAPGALIGSRLASHSCPGLTCAPGLSSDSGHSSQLDWDARGAGRPSRHCHQPPPTSLVPCWQGQPPLAADSTQLPTPSVSPVSCPSLLSPPSSCFPGRVSAHSGQQPQ